MYTRDLLFIHYKRVQASEILRKYIFKYLCVNSCRTQNFLTHNHEKSRRLRKITFKYIAPQISLDQCYYLEFIQTHETLRNRCTKHEGNF